MKRRIESSEWIISVKKNGEKKISSNESKNVVCGNNNSFKSLTKT